MPRCDDARPLSTRAATTPPRPPTPAAQHADRVPQRRHFPRHQANDAFNLVRLLVGGDLFAAQKFRQHVIEGTFVHDRHRYMPQYGPNNWGPRSSGLVSGSLHRVPPSSLSWLLTSNL